MGDIGQQSSGSLMCEARAAIHEFEHSLARALDVALRHDTGDCSASMEMLQSHDRLMAEIELIKDHVKRYAH